MDINLNMQAGLQGIDISGLGVLSSENMLGGEMQAVDFMTLILNLIQNTQSDSGENSADGIFQNDLFQGLLNFSENPSEDGVQSEFTALFENMPQEQFESIKNLLSQMELSNVNQDIQTTADDLQSANDALQPSEIVSDSTDKVVIADNILQIISDVIESADADTSQKLGEIISNLSKNPVVNNNSNNAVNSQEFPTYDIFVHSDSQVTQGQNGQSAENEMPQQDIAAPEIPDNTVSDDVVSEGIVFEEQDNAVTAPGNDIQTEDNTHNPDDAYVTGGENQNVSDNPDVAPEPEENTQKENNAISDVEAELLKSAQKQRETDENKNIAPKGEVLTDKKTVETAVSDDTKTISAVEAMSVSDESSKEIPVSEKSAALESDISKEIPVNQNFDSSNLTPSNDNFSESYVQDLNTLSGLSAENSDYVPNDSKPYGYESQNSQNNAKIVTGVSETETDLNSESESSSFNAEQDLQSPSDEEVNFNSLIVLDGNKTNYNQQINPEASGIIIHNTPNSDVQTNASSLNSENIPYADNAVYNYRTNISENSAVTSDIQANTQNVFTLQANHPRQIHENIQNINNSQQSAPDKPADTQPELKGIAVERQPLPDSDTNTNSSDYFKFVRQLRQSVKENTSNFADKDDLNNIDADAIQQNVRTLDFRNVFTNISNAGHTEESSPAQQVNNALMQNLAQGKDEFVVKLRPEGLGEITVKIQRGEDGSGVLTMAASSGKTAQLLNGELASLQQSVVHLNMTVNEVQVQQAAPNEQYNPYNEQYSQQHENENGGGHKQNHSNHNAFSFNEDNNESDFEDEINEDIMQGVLAYI